MLSVEPPVVDNKHALVLDGSNAHAAVQTRPEASTAIPTGTSSVLHGSDATKFVKMPSNKGAQEPGNSSGDVQGQVAPKKKPWRTARSAKEQRKISSKSSRSSR